jgi:glycosyltransferase involved in cell wall biosynthesis
MVTPRFEFRNILYFLKVYGSALLLPGKNSLIVIQSVYADSLYARSLKVLARLRKKRVFYDLDDADYLRYPPHNIHFFLRQCAAVTLGSRELVKNLSGNNERTYLVTCPVPDLGIVKKKKNEVLTIGWIGDFTKGHKESLMSTFFPALGAVDFPVKLVMLGANRSEEHGPLLDHLAQFRHVTVDIPEHIDWMNERAIQEKIATFDVGIATLLDNEFYRSKSAFKLKQCFNNGVPVLSTDLPENSFFLEDGANGYFCNTSEEFGLRLREFRDMDEQTYHRFSANARAAVARFDLEYFCGRLSRIFGEVVH